MAHNSPPRELRSIFKLVKNMKQSPALFTKTIQRLEIYQRRKLGMLNSWSRDSKISLVAIVVAVLGLVVTAIVTVFAPDIHESLRLPATFSLLLNRNAMRIALVLATFCAIMGTILAIRLPREFRRGWLLSAFMVTLVAGMAVGIVATRTTPIVFIGSRNVKDYLQERIDLEKMKPLWLGVPSEKGLPVLFHAFRYGTLTESGNERQGLVAVSSYGITPLEDSLTDPKIQQDQKDHNYFLSITVVRPLLALLYRPPPKDKAQGFPKVRPLGTGSEKFVHCSDLMGFYQDASPAVEGWRYIPEPNTGTRDAYQAACETETATKWQSHNKSPEDYIEGFKDTFVNLVSWPPASRNPSVKVTCNYLNDLGIQVAALCSKKGYSKEECSDLARAEHTVVMKLTKAANQRDFKITNSSECKIAQLLTLDDEATNVTTAMKGKIKNCLVDGTDVQNNIVRIDATIPKGPDPPAHITCSY